MAQAYGEEMGKQMSWFTGTFGLPPYANLTVVETEEGAPNGYAAPGPDLPLAARHRQAAQRPPAGQPDLAPVVGRAGFRRHPQPALAHQRPGGVFRTAVDRARRRRRPPWKRQLHDLMVEALTVDNVPIIQSARLDDYSPELWALTGSKGAAVMHMLRDVMGDEKFVATLRRTPQQNAWKAVTTDDFRKVAEAASGQDLGCFFIQWIESSGAPEFKLEYTIYRDPRKGFRVMGKIRRIWTRSACRWI